MFVSSVSVIDCDVPCKWLPLKIEAVYSFCLWFRLWYIACAYSIDVLLQHIHTCSPPYQLYVSLAPKSPLNLFLQCSICHELCWTLFVSSFTAVVVLYFYLISIFLISRPFSLIILYPFTWFRTVRHLQCTYHSKRLFSVTHPTWGPDLKFIFLFSLIIHVCSFRFVCVHMTNNIPWLWVCVFFRFIRHFKLDLMTIFLLIFITFTPLAC